MLTFSMRSKSVGSLLAIVLACGGEEQIEPYLIQGGSAEQGEPPNITTVIEKTAAGDVAVLKTQELDNPASPIPDDEYAAWDEYRAAQGAVRDGTIPVSPTAVAVDLAAGRPPTEMIPLNVMLKEPGFDFGRFKEAKRGTTPDEARAKRADLIAERQEQVLNAGQSEIAAGLVALGADIKSQYWLVNRIRVDVPARFVEIVASWPQVVELQYQDPSINPSPASDGKDIREDTLVGNLLDRGYNASRGTLHSWVGPNVMIGIIEDDANGANGYVRRNHRVFQEAPGNTNSRFGGVYECNPNCVPTNSLGTANTSSTQSHGTTVSWLAAGSIMNGIDPNFPGTNTVSQKMRSGVAQESYLFYYRTSTYSTVSNAIQQALSDNVDIINYSASSNEECDDGNVTPWTFNQSINEDLRYALDSGVLFVTVSGNSHAAGDSCSVNYPGWRPESLTVGATDTAGSTTDTNSSLLQTTSSRGLTRIRYENGQFAETAHPSVVLVAPGVVESYPNSSTGYDGDGGVARVSRYGTSFASPIVAGSAANLMQPFEGTFIDATDVFISMMLMGNGFWSGVNNLDENWGGEQTGVSHWASPSSGFGKLSMHFPRSTDPTLGSGSYWRWSITSARTVTQGVNTWWAANADSSGTNVPFPPDATQFKWAFAYFPTSLNDYGSMGMEVWEAPCNATNPLTGTLRARDWNTSSRKRIQMFGSAIANKCLWLVVKPYYTPGNSVLVHNTFYYHSGNTASH